MVTLPRDAASDYRYVRDLVECGTDVVRINCAHDGPEDWAAMAAHARRAAAETGRSCRVLMDLEGPRARTGQVQGRSTEVRVSVGDQVRLVAGEPRRAPDPPEIQCSLPEAVRQLRPGHSVCIDEARIRLVVDDVADRGALLTVTTVESKGCVKSNKGLNVPDLELELDPLTAKDLADLDVAVEIADIIGYSFVQKPSDLERLQNELALRGRAEVPLIAKIETRAAVARLPELIVKAAGTNRSQ